MATEALGNYRNWAAFFVLGSINNLPYVVINSAAKSIVTEFHAPTLIGAIPWANNLFGFIARLINAFVINDCPYRYRFYANAVMMLCGLVCVAYSPTLILALASIVIIGMGSAFGESFTLGYLRLYPAELVGGWSSGTGMAGVGGACLYMFFSFLELSNKTSFMLCVPFVGVYLFFYMILEKPQYEKRVRRRAGSSSNGSDGGISEEESDLLEQGERAEDVEESFCAKFSRCVELVWWLSANLFLVYFFEYVISSGFASECLPKHLAERDEFYYKNSYEILAFCYQLGVFVSRSSLKYVKITRVEILTLIQGINFALWYFQVVFKTFNIWVLYLHMIFVGLMGGGSYVNIFYLLINNKNITSKDKDLCVNITAIMNTLGITLACVFVLLADNTFLAGYK
eukprot:Nk52_evm65s236 gene=Nk52_evmTU65s236